MKVRISARAARELHRQIDWLEALSPKAARDARKALQDGIQMLIEHPFAAPRVTRRQRQLTVHYGQHGFIVRYHVDADVISINRVLHGRQNR